MAHSQADTDTLSGYLCRSYLTPKRDLSPSSTEPSPLIPSPTTPAATSAPRHTYNRKVKRKVNIHDASPHSDRSRSDFTTAPVLVIGAPLQRSIYDRENTPPPVDLDGSGSPPPSPGLQFVPLPSAPSKHPPRSGSLVYRVTGSKFCPSDDARSPPSPTPAKPIRGFAPSPPGYRPMLAPHASLSSLHLSVTPPIASRDKLDYYTEPNRGVQVNPPDDVAKGETILRTTPLHSVLHSPLLETHCSGCFQSPEHKASQHNITIEAARKMFLDCSRCKAVHFCSVVYHYL